MGRFYNNFLGVLEKEDKDACVKMVLNALDKGEISIQGLYEDVLSPAMNLMECTLEDQKICAWKEHVRASIIRTIIECCYPHIMRQRESMECDNKDKRVAVLCPPDEMHEIGARMVADFFSLCGYDVLFVGASTPIDDFVAAVHHIKPDYVAISVTNYYNIIAVRKAIQCLAGKLPPETRIIVGGRAFEHNPELYREIGAHYVMKSYDDVEAMAQKTCSPKEKDDVSREQETGGNVQ